MGTSSIMNGNCVRRASIVIGIILTTMLLVSCFGMYGKKNSTEQSKDEQAVRNVLMELKDRYEGERTVQFMKLVHSDYQGYQSDLRSNVSDVFSKYSSIELTFRSIRTNRENGSLFAETWWNLRWQCDEPITRTDSHGDVICQNLAGGEDDVVLRRGQTTFDLKKVDDQYKLYNQRGKTTLFGNEAPGEVHSRK